jgi:hypothetical protein
MMTCTAWTGCYRQRWDDIPVPAAYDHPAKFARGLAQRLYAHAAEEGWLWPGAVVLDPFGGVGLGAYDSLLAGYHWLGIELEPTFVDIGQHNLVRWQQRYGQLPHYGTAVLLQGDSRLLTQHVQGLADVVCSSPPYSGNDKCDYLMSDDGKTRKRDLKRAYRQGNGCFRGSETYGGSPGQLGALPPGTLADALVSSPLYADGCGHTGGTDLHPEHVQGGLVHHVAYGSTPGNLGHLSAGQVAAVVSSPPFRDVNGKQSIGIDPAKHHSKPMGPHSCAFKQGLGCFPGQLANDSPTTFWAAARQIVEQCYALLKPGGVALWVTKAYVRHKQRVDFPGDWRRLCEHVGFVTLHEHRAMLVEEYGVQGHLFGEAQAVTVKRASFFRILAEKNGSPRIDWETVLCMQKPLTGEGQVAMVVSSPPYTSTNTEPTALGRGKGTRGTGNSADRNKGDYHYGRTPGQLSAMPLGQREGSGGE